MHDGSLIDLPPVLFGKLGNDPSKKTVLVYGHLDVQPALKVLAHLLCQDSGVISIFRMMAGTLSRSS